MRTHNILEAPRVCDTCLSNAQQRRSLRPRGKSLAEHYRDLVRKSEHSFNVLEELPKRLRSESGVVIAEAAIILPVLVLLSLALIDIQWMTRTAAAIEYIVTETARCEAIQSGACTAPNSPQQFAHKLAQNMRLSIDPEAMQLSTPVCSPNECTVSITYTYKALGAWFPRITIQRTGNAAVSPPTGGQP